MKKKKVGLIVAAAIVAIIGIVAGGSYLCDLYTLKPHWVYLSSPEKNGRVLTVFYPKWFPRNGEIYFIPGRYTATTIPSGNYVKTYPNTEASIKVNWQPDDGYLLKFEYPLIGMKYEDHLDTTLYRMYENGNKPGYIDKGDSFHFPKYEGFTYGQWMLKEYRENPF